MTLTEKRSMRYMGYTIRAWYMNPSGVPFHKDFRTGDEMEVFTEKAIKVGTKMTGFASIDKGVL